MKKERRYLLHELIGGYVIDHPKLKYYDIKFNNRDTTLALAREQYENQTEKFSLNYNPVFYNFCKGDKALFISEYYNVVMWFPYPVTEKFLNCEVDSFCDYDSPFIIQIVSKYGISIGKAAIRTYWKLGKKHEEKLEATEDEEYNVMCGK